MCPAKECRILIGRHRCAEADLVVVPDISILHNVDALAADVDLAVSFLYIVSLGVDIATKTQLAAVQGVPRRLSPQHLLASRPSTDTKGDFLRGTAPQS